MLHVLKRHPIAVRARSIVRIEGRRRGWKPRMVPAIVHTAEFLTRFANARLASAFLVEDIPYCWQRGVRTPASA